MNILHKAAAFALAFFTLAPSFKAMFDLDDLVAYYLPFGLFATFSIVSNLLHLNSFPPRITVASIFLFLVAGPVYAFYLTGGVELDLLSLFLLNCLAAGLVVIYPWNEDALNSLLQAFAVIGCIVSIYTMLYLGSDDALVERSADGGANNIYLTTSFTMGVGVISATYFLVKRFNPFTIGIFGLTWLGIALGRGRGAFLFCVLVAILYLIIAMSSRIANFGRAKKMIMVTLVVAFIPVVFTQTMKMSRMREGLTRILFSPDVEADVGGRGTAFSQGVARYLESPVFGNGLGAYASDDHAHPHNLFITWAVDGGLVSTTFLTVFYLCIAVVFFKSVNRSSQANINVVYASAALCTYMFLNLLKSYDPYLNREFYILSALPLAAYCAVLRSRIRNPASRQRRRRVIRATGRPHTLR